VIGDKNPIRKFCFATKPDKHSTHVITVASWTTCSNYRQELANTAVIMVTLILTSSIGKETCCENQHLYASLGDTKSNSIIAVNIRRASKRNVNSFSVAVGLW